MFHRCCFDVNIFEEKKKEEDVPTSSTADPVLSMPTRKRLTAPRRTSEVQMASETLLPPILGAFASQLLRICKTNVLEVDSDAVVTEPTKISTKAYLLSTKPLYCEPSSPGYPTEYIPVPVSHTLGFWVWIPEGSTDGILIVKGGPSTKDSRFSEYWSSLEVLMENGFACICVPSVKFKVQSKKELAVNSWTHVAYTIDVSQKSLKIYINGVFSNSNVLPLQLYSKGLTTKVEKQTIATPHEYENDMKKWWTINVPNALKYVVTCHKDSKTEEKYDYLQFFTGTTRNSRIGDEKYSGTKFPGVNGTPPLEIKSGSFEMYFFSDGSTTYWGFEAEVAAHVQVESTPEIDPHRNMCEYPFYIGSCPGYVTSKRATTCIVSSVCAFMEPLSERDLAMLPAETSLKCSIDGSLDIQTRSAISCPLNSPHPQNAFFGFPALRSRIKLSITGRQAPITASTDDEKSGIAASMFSIGVLHKSSFPSENSNIPTILFGKDLVSYGIYNKEHEFVLRHSRAKKHIPLTRDLRVGDSISIDLNLPAHCLQITIRGEGLSMTKNFGISREATDPNEFIGGVTLDSGWSVALEAADPSSESSGIGAIRLPETLQSFRHLEHELKKCPVGRISVAKCDICNCSGYFSS